MQRATFEPKSRTPPRSFLRSTRPQSASASLAGGRGADLGMFISVSPIRSPVKKPSPSSQNGSEAAREEKERLEAARKRIDATIRAGVARKMAARGVSSAKSSPMSVENLRITNGNTARTPSERMRPASAPRVRSPAGSPRLSVVARHVPIRTGKGETEGGDNGSPMRKDSPPITDNESKNNHGGNGKQQEMMHHRHDQVLFRAAGTSADIRCQPAQRFVSEPEPSAQRKGSEDGNNRPPRRGSESGSPAAIPRRFSVQDSPNRRRRPSEVLAESLLAGFRNPQASRSSSHLGVSPVKSDSARDPLDDHTIGAWADTGEDDIGGGVVPEASLRAPVVDVVPRRKRLPKAGAKSRGKKSAHHHSRAGVTKTSTNNGQADLKGTHAVAAGGGIPAGVQKATDPSSTGRRRMPPRPKSAMASPTKTTVSTAVHELPSDVVPFEVRRQPIHARQVPSTHGTAHDPTVAAERPKTPKEPNTRLLQESERQPASNNNLKHNRQEPKQERQPENPKATGNGSGPGKTTAAAKFASAPRFTGELETPKLTVAAVLEREMRKREEAMARESQQRSSDGSTDDDQHAMRFRSGSGSDSSRATDDERRPASPPLSGW